MPPKLDKINGHVTRDFGEEIRALQILVADFFEDLEGTDRLQNIMDTNFMSVKELIKLREHPIKNKEAIRDTVKLIKDEIRQLLYFGQQDRRDAVACDAAARFLYAGLVIATQSKAITKTHGALREIRIDALSKIGMQIDTGMNF